MIRTRCSICWFVWFIWVMVLAMRTEWKGYSEACLESERIGLLDINAYFQNYSDHRLPAWNTKSSSDECCNWEGVGCGKFTGRVTSLSIYDVMYSILNRYTTSYDKGYKDLYVNASLFLPFQKLARLSLNELGIVDSLENEGFDKLSLLIDLEFLDLKLNRIDNKMLSSLSTLSSLKYLNLFGNHLTAQLKGFEEMSNLINLEYLDLGGNDLGNNILPYLRGMSSLQYLDLYNVGLNGPISIEGLRALRKLEGIDLAGNNVVFTGLAMLSNLKGLIIDATSLCELQGISRMTRLEKIWLFDFSMSTNITLLQSLSILSSLKSLEFSNSNLHSQEWPVGFKKLEHLSIHDSIIYGDFLYTIGTMTTNLKSLTITNSSLQSTISRGLCNLKNLQTLKLRYTNLIGELPQCLSNLTALQVFDIFGNGLHGDISQSPLTKLLSLILVEISSNEFRIPLSLSPFFNHSRLQYFYGVDNQVVHEEHQWLIPPLVLPRFQLRSLILSSRHDDGGYVGPLPKFLYHQRSLETLSISDTKMEVDTFPWWLLDNNTNLQVLGIVNCSLSPSFQLPKYLHPHEKLDTLDISHNNYIHGTIPPHIGTILPNLIVLFMSENKLSGTIPEQLSNCSYLALLHVSGNNLSGQIPGQIWDMYQLVAIDLSRNKLSGSISPRFFSPWIYEVYLSRNKLRGVIPSREDEGISRANYKLQALDLSHNGFSGNIPKWIIGVPHLNYLKLNNNKFSGGVVMTFCFERFRMIDVSHNDLSGHLASAILSTKNCSDEIFHIQPMGGIDFITKTQAYTYRGKPLGLMSGMDFSSNKFTGEIPPQIGINFIDIKALNFSYNKLQGQIPSTFAYLHAIESLDLSHNNLNGSIPPQLTELSSLSFFSVAYNNLSGKCPKLIAQFSTFNENNYLGNQFLCCTFPVQPLQPLLLPAASHEGDDDDEEGFIDMEVFYASTGVTTIMTLLIIVVVLYINSHWRQVWFYYVKMVASICCYFVVDYLPLPARYKMWVF